MIPRAVTTYATDSASSLPSTTSDKPFFPDPTSYTSPTPSTTNEREPQSKVILEWVFIVVVIFIGLLIALMRIRQLKRAQRPMKQFFMIAPGSRSRTSATHAHANQSFPRTTGLPTVSPSTANGQSPHLLPLQHLYPTHLFPTTLPSLGNNPNTQRTRANDIDASGRRLGGGGGTDHNGELDDKDTLPAYDLAGGPPRYLDVAALMRPQGEGEVEARFVGSVVTPSGNMPPRYGVNSSEVGREGQGDAGATAAESQREEDEVDVGVAGLQARRTSEEQGERRLEERRGSAEHPTPTNTRSL